MSLKSASVKFIVPELNCTVAIPVRSGVANVPLRLLAAVTIANESFSVGTKPPLNSTVRVPPLRVAEPDDDASVPKSFGPPIWTVGSRSTN